LLKFLYRLSSFHLLILHITHLQTGKAGLFKKVIRRRLLNRHSEGDKKDFYSYRTRLCTWPIILVILVWIQSRQTQQEIDGTLRPWIGSALETFQKPDNVIIKLKNHGRIPAKTYSIKLLVETQDIKMENLQQQGKEHTEIISVLSGDIRNYIVRLDIDDMKKISGKKSMVSWNANKLLLCK
jgi:hypothetical protein